MSEYWREEGRGLMTCFRASLLASASVAGLVLSTSALAQDQSSGTATAQAATATDQAQAPSDKGAQAIIVTGLRKSLATAQSIKRNSQALVDSIVAEDIGKLP